MAIRIVRLGTPRLADEGLRLGTVRRPPRGVKKSDYAVRDFYDVWLPNLAPSAELLKDANPAAGEQEWKLFARRFRAEMKQHDAAHLLDLLAALSQRTHFALGCYCENEARCHRSLLRELLQQRGARLV